jgi:hypothetical protein
VAKKDKGSKAKDTPEEISRRKFLRRSAEVAALSLFGVMGLEPVMEAVLQRVREIKAVEEIADRVAEDLRLNAAAYADGFPHHHHGGSHCGCPT